MRIPADADDSDPEDSGLESILLKGTELLSSCAKGKFERVAGRVCSTYLQVYMPHI